MQFETGRADYPAVRFSNTRMRRVSCFEQRLGLLTKTWSDCFARHYGLYRSLFGNGENASACQSFATLLPFLHSLQDYFAPRHHFRGYLIPDNRFFIIEGFSTIQYPIRALETKLRPCRTAFFSQRWHAHYLYDGFYPRYTFLS